MNLLLINCNLLSWEKPTCHLQAPSRKFLHVSFKIQSFFCIRKMLFLQGENSAQKIKTGWGGVDWESLRFLSGFLSISEILSLKFSPIIATIIFPCQEKADPKNHPNPPHLPTAKKITNFLSISFSFGSLKRRKKYPE